MPISKLEKYSTPLLNITDRERNRGMKYVFQTDIEGSSVGELSRAPMGMFAEEELYIDNDVQLVLDRAYKFYGIK